jgi:hypothetical protein
MGTPEGRRRLGRRRGASHVAPFASPPDPSYVKPRGDRFHDARSARLVDGADEVHMQQIAMGVIEAFRETGSTRRATGADLL